MRTDPEDVLAEPLYQAATRLREFIRAHAPGGCRVLSKGDDCHCPLCDLDDLASAVEPKGTRKTRLVPVAVELLPKLGEWSEPVQIKVAAENPNGIIELQVRVLQ